MSPRPLRRSSGAPSVLALVLLAVVGCGDRPAAEPGSLSWSDLPEEEFPYRVAGVSEYPEGELLEGPVDVALGSGKVWVLDGAASELHVLTGDGVFVRSVGGPGGGPEELSQPSAVVVNGDTVRVLDTGNARIQYFDTAGSHRRTNPYSNVVDAPLFDAALWRGAWYGALLATERPLRRLSAGGDDSASVATRAGAALWERHARWDRERGSSAPISPRLQVAAGRLWLLDTFHPVAVATDADGSGFTVVDYPLLPSMERDGSRPAGDRPRSREPAGSFGVLPDPETEAGAFVVTQQIDDGRQLAARVDAEGDVVARARLPSGLRLLSVAVGSPDVFAVALRGEMEIPRVVRLSPVGPGGP